MAALALTVIPVVITFLNRPAPMYHGERDQGMTLRP
jgi:hypothetical protein